MGGLAERGDPIFQRRFNTSARRRARRSFPREQVLGGEEGHFGDRSPWQTKSIAYYHTRGC
jgi:hypothetical protein